MAWPTRTEVQAQFENLNNASLNTKIDKAIEFATARVKAAGFALGYDVSLWTASTPPLAYHIALYLVYGYFAPRVHTGAQLKPSDEAAKDAREYAEELLKQLQEGKLELSDASDVKLALRSFTGFLHKRTEKPMFTPDAPETWELLLPLEGDEFE